MNRGMSGHQATVGRSMEWYTPPAVFEALGLEFDLDPASPGADVVPWVPARRHMTEDDDGLRSPWEGRVWLNPPYGGEVYRWMGRMAAHRDGIALVFARTETRWAQLAIGVCDAVCFMAGRLNFTPGDPSFVAKNRTNSSAGAPSMLLAYGSVCAEAVARSGLGLTFAVERDVDHAQGRLWAQR